MFKIYSGFIYINWDDFIPLEYSSEEGLVFQDRKTYSNIGRSPSVKTEITTKDTQFTIKEVLFVYRATVSRFLSNKYMRIYPKLQSVVAYIGGMMKFIITIAQILSNYVSTKLMNFNIVQEIVSYKKDKKSPNDSIKSIENVFS